MKTSLIINFQALNKLNNSIWVEKFIKSSGKIENIKNSAKYKKVIKNFTKLKFLKDLGF